MSTEGALNYDDRTPKMVAEEQKQNGVDYDQEQSRKLDQERIADDAVSGRQAALECCDEFGLYDDDSFRLPRGDGLTNDVVDWLNANATEGVLVEFNDFLKEAKATRLKCDDLKRSWQFQCEEHRLLKEQHNFRGLIAATIKRWRRHVANLAYRVYRQTDNEVF